MKKKIIAIIILALIIVSGSIVGVLLYKQNQLNNIWAVIAITDNNGTSSKTYHIGDYLEISEEKIKVDDMLLNHNNTKSIESVVLRCDNKIFDNPNGKMEIIAIHQEREITLNNETIKIKVEDINNGKGGE